MNITEPLSLLGGRSPESFMRRYWHKRPLLIRNAIAEFGPLLDRAELFDLAAQDDVESRLISQNQTPPGDALARNRPKAARKSSSRAASKLQKTTAHEAAASTEWQFRRGPFSRRMLPALSQRQWTLLVQGVNLYDERVRSLMNQFRFIPDARLDDLMISYATDGGGVGPHFDSYDVFLLQAHGRRRWRIGRQQDFSLMPDMPLKILANFAPEEEHVLEPGDMLYLPPRWAHDGIAEGECMTYSIGFRSPGKVELAQELLQRLADQAAEALDESVYRDPQQPAVQHSGEVPPGLLAFAQDALRKVLADPQALPRALGEYMSEPKAHVWFSQVEPGQDLGAGNVYLDRRSRMLYDARHIFINGESFVASGRDARIMRKLCDAQCLSAKEVQALSEPARELLAQWCEDGWVYVSA